MINAKSLFDEIFIHKMYEIPWKTLKIRFRYQIKQAFLHQGDLEGRLSKCNFIDWYEFQIEHFI